VTLAARRSPSARIVADSVSPAGVRLVTVEAHIHRFVLAELNTHRALSRNSASSRARPVSKVLADVVDDPAFPVEWGRNQSGMQAHERVSDDAAARADEVWLAARDAAVAHAQQLADIGVHKQLVNRVLEPFLWHVVVVSATEWDNFFAQRCHPDAQPEIRVAAEAMRDAIAASTPTPVANGGWHLPYLRPGELDELDAAGHDVEIAKRISVARCARVSYLTQDGVRDWSKDLDLYDRLTTQQPPHASPLEHVATPDAHGTGNFRGWQQLRHVVLEADAFPN
jgi:thymidylate synthase ThyX